MGVLLTLPRLPTTLRLLPAIFRSCADGGTVPSTEAAAWALGFAWRGAREGRACPEGLRDGMISTTARGIENAGISTTARGIERPELTAPRALGRLLKHDNLIGLKTILPPLKSDGFTVPELRSLYTQMLEQKAEETKEADAGAAVARACGVDNK